MRNKSTESIIVSSNRPEVDFDENSLIEDKKPVKKKAKKIDPDLANIDAFLESAQTYESVHIPCQIRLVANHSKDISFIGHLENFSSSYERFEATVVVSLDEFKKIYTMMSEINVNSNILKELELLSESTADDTEENKENLVAMPLISNTREISDILFSIDTKEKNIEPTAKITIRCGIYSNYRNL